jgi:hypothetical protein
LLTLSGAPRNAFTAIDDFSLVAGRQRMDFVDNCYLIHHAQGWLLWDTGVADAIAGHARWPSAC